MASKGKATMAQAEDIRLLHRQGADPLVYAAALARRWAVSVDQARGIIAGVGGTIRTVDDESVARERLTEDRAAAGTNAFRGWNHEEE